MIWIAQTSDITLMNRPVTNPVALGDTCKIVTAHTWAEDTGAFKWDSKLHSVKCTGAPVGDAGSQQIEYTAEVVVLGDNAAIQEMVTQAMNDDIIVFLKEANCIENDAYVQLGDDCNPVEVVPSFDSFTTAEGQKAWTIQFKSKKKFFYLAALTEAE